MMESPIDMETLIGALGRILRGELKEEEKLHPNLPERMPSMSEDARKRILLLLEAYKANRKELLDRKLLNFDQASYTKNFLCEWLNRPERGSICVLPDGPNRTSNMMVMCWGPGQASAIHGHEGSHCFVKVLQGEIVEERMAHPNHLTAAAPREGSPACDKTVTPGEVLERKTYKVNDVTYIEDSIGCHRVRNPSNTQQAVTLHIYAPSYRLCRVFESEGSSPELTMSRSRLERVTFVN